MAFEISGKVIEISPVNQVSDKFKKREFVIERKETGGSAVFIDYIKFQLLQDKSDLINESYLNEEVKVTFNIKGNKWERDGKVSYFTNLDAWKLERLQTSRGADIAAPPSQFDDAAQDVSELDDLPF